MPAMWPSPAPTRPTTNANRPGPVRSASENSALWSRCSKNSPPPRPPPKPTAGSDGRTGSGLLGLTDVDQPADAEPVHARAEHVAPHLLLQRDRDGTAVGELVPVAAQLLV